MVWNILVEYKILTNRFHAEEDKTKKTKKRSWEYLLTLKFEFGINIQSY